MPPDLDGPADGAITVFYDGACPLCSREIGHYRKLAASAPVVWLDVTQPDAPLDAYGIRYTDAMARFHVLDAEGRWHVGIRGFLRLWQVLPGYRWLAVFIAAVPGMTPLMHWLYERFAAWHFRRRCTRESCGGMS